MRQGPGSGPQPGRSLADSYKVFCEQALTFQSLQEVASLLIQWGCDSKNALSLWCMWDTQDVGSERQP